MTLIHAVAQHQPHALPLSMRVSPSILDAVASRLHADDRERLEYLHKRIVELEPLGAAGHERAAERLAIVVGRLADRGDDWALRVRRSWPAAL